jgi:hypothetical protein
MSAAELDDAAARICARIDELTAIENTYRDYLQQRIDEDDLHGTWDGAINIAETTAEIAGLNFALTAIRAVVCG